MEERVKISYRMVCEYSSMFQGIVSRLMNFDSRRGQDDAGVEDEQDKFAVNLHRHGCVEVMKKL